MPYFRIRKIYNSDIIWAETERKIVEKKKKKYMGEGYHKNRYLIYSIGCAE